MEISYDKSWFKKLEKIVRPFDDFRIQQAFRQAILLIVRLAKIMAPRGAYSMGIDELKNPADVTGDLRSRIAMGKIINYGDALEGSVGTNSPYGKFQEYGTGKRGASTFEGLLPDNYKHGKVAGIRAKMFLTKSSQQVYDEELIPKMREALQIVWGDIA